MAYKDPNYLRDQLDLAYKLSERISELPEIDDVDSIENVLRPHAEKLGVDLDSAVNAWLGQGGKDYGLSGQSPWADWNKYNKQFE